MGTVQAVREERASKAGVGAAEFKRLLDEALSDVDADETAGPLLRAAGLRMQFHFPDLNLVLSVAASEEGRHHLRWEFSERVDWKPRLNLTMDSKVANAYLQGKESLAIAIARGRVRCSGEARSALLYVPALRLVVEPYRRLVHDEYPHLALD